MSFMDSNLITEDFLSYFAKNGHVHVDGCSIIPEGDDLLFTNAGMNQFKGILSGRVEAPHKRVCSVQRCVRVGGKHNDFEDVGKDSYHHTCFDMLGSWSFGDYGVAHAIDLAFHWLVNALKLERSRLYVTYFSGNAMLPADETSLQTWRRYLPENHILPFGDEHNVWTMGRTGPVGCCTEIHYDLTGSCNAIEKVNTANGDVIELWNIVIVTHQILDDGSICELGTKSIDTGAGLERITAACQKRYSTYSTDIFRDTMDKVRWLSEDELSYEDSYGEAHKEDQAMRIIADHTRLLQTLLSENVRPGPKERNYIVRKALRRILWNAHSVLRLSRGCLFDLLSSSNFQVTPEMKSMLEKEEKLFQQVYDSSRRRVAKCEKPLSGPDAFYLLSTHGIKAELLEQIAEEQKFEVDWLSFEEQCAKHQMVSGK